MFATLITKIKYNDREAFRKTVAPLERAWQRAGEVLLNTAFQVARTITVTARGYVYVAYRTGELAHSLGTAFSPVNTSSFGPITTIGGVTYPPSGLPHSNPQGVTLALVSTCGYGFYVHQGTWKVPSRPFALQALEQVKHLFLQYSQEEAAKHE